MKIRRVYNTPVGGATSSRSPSELGPRHRPREEGAIKESQTVRRYAPPSIPLRHIVLHPTPPVARASAPYFKNPSTVSRQVPSKMDKEREREREPTGTRFSYENSRAPAWPGNATAFDPLFSFHGQIVSMRFPNYVYRSYVIPLWFLREINYFRESNFKIRNTSQFSTFCSSLQNLVTCNEIEVKSPKVVDTRSRLESQLEGETLCVLASGKLKSSLFA